MPRIGRSAIAQWREPNIGGAEPAFGPEPPQRILGLPTQQMQTVRVVLAAQSRRVTEVRRFPKQGLEGSEIFVGPLGSGRKTFGAFERAMGPMPPVVVGGVFTAPPIVVAPATGLATNWRRAQQRQTRYMLGAPIGTETATFVAPPIQVIPAAPPNGRRRRRAFPPMLFPPTVISAGQVFAGPQVALTSRACRDTQARRFPLQGWAQIPCDETNGNPYPLSPQTIMAGGQTFQGSDVWGTTTSSREAQKFSSVRGVLTSVSVRINKRSTPIDNVFAEIYTNAPQGTFGKPGTLLGTSASVAGSTLDTGGATSLYTTFTFAVPIEVAGSVWVVMRRDGAPDDLNNYGWNTSAASSRPPSPEGPNAVYSDAGGTWDSTIPQSMWARMTFAPFALQQILQARFLGVRPPLVIDPLPSREAQTVKARSLRQAVVRRQQAQQREPKSLLFPPATLAQPPPTIYGPLVKLTQTRPRHTIHALSAPVVVRVPSVEQLEQTVRVNIARTRPRPVIRQLGAPKVIRVPSVEQAEQTIRVSLTRTRPRPTTRSLRPPTVLRTFSGPRVTLARIKPRPTVTKVTPPTVVRVPSVEQAEQTIRVSLIRTRPRPTVHSVKPPTTLQEFFGPVEVEVAVRIPLEDKRRTPHTRLSPPVVLQTFASPFVALTHTRPRATTRTLAPPVVVDTPSVQQQQRTIRVTLARTRPRPTVNHLFAPTDLQTFRGPEVVLTRARPRPTVKQVFAPRVLLVPSVEQRLRTLTSKLTQTRPRPTHVRLSPPTVLATPAPVVTDIAVVSAVLRTRYEQKRHFPLPGWRQRLVRETGSTVVFPMFDPLLGPRPPQIIDPLPTLREQTIKATLAAVRTRVEAKRHFPLPGFTSQLVRESGAAAAVIQSLRKPLLGVRPPTIIGPLPTQTQQTVASKLVALRTRVEQQRHTPRPFLSPPAVVGTAPPVESTVRVKLAAVRRGVEQQRHAQHSKLSDPVFYEAKSEISVTTVAVRTRVETSRRAAHSFLTEISYPAKSRITVALAGRTRVEAQRRATHWNLSPPVVVLVPSVEQAEETIRVVLAGRTRLEVSRRNPHWRLTYVRYAATSRITVRLAGRARTEVARRAAHSKLSRPVFPPPSLAQQTITTILVATRPRRTTHQLRPAAALKPVETRIRVALARTRPRPTVRTLRRPAVVTPVAAPVVTTITVLLAGENRLRIPTVRSNLSAPTSIIVGLPGVTYGEDWAATTVEDDIIGATTAPSSSIASTSAGVQDSAAVSSTIEDIADTTVESSDQEAGT